MEVWINLRMTRPHAEALLNILEDYSCGGLPGFYRDALRNMVVEAIRVEERNRCFTGTQPLIVDDDSALQASRFLNRVLSIITFLIVAGVSWMFTYFSLPWWAYVALFASYILWFAAGVMYEDLQEEERQHARRKAEQVERSRDSEFIKKQHKKQQEPAS